VSEFDRIARLTRRFGRPAPPVIGIGDDCAVIPSGDKPLALSVDAAVEGVHFTRALVSLDCASERAVEAALSDLAAVGANTGDPRAGILCALTLPPSLSERDFDALIEGIARAAERNHATVLGGNLASAETLTITTTVIGAVASRAVTRSGARPGDRVYVTGAVGAAALGLRALLAGRGDEAWFGPFVTRWRAPRARLEAGVAIAPFASAAVDISDGLAQDAGHIARASGCRIVIDSSAIPMLEGQIEAARALGCNAVELALTGGEDYELCFTASGAREGWFAIGEVVEGSGVAVRDGASVRDAVMAGWDHFR
jgi:thiamine-monophosphate kinase